MTAQCQNYQGNEPTSQHLVLVISEVPDGVAGVRDERSHSSAAHAHLGIRHCDRSQQPQSASHMWVLSALVGMCSTPA